MGCLCPKIFNQHKTFEVLISVICFSQIKQINR
jgi:hypothetical protein